MYKIISANEAVAVANMNIEATPMAAAGRRSIFFTMQIRRKTKPLFLFAWSTIKKV
jgi:hypothetical protein